LSQFYPSFILSIVVAVARLTILEVEQNQLILSVVATYGALVENHDAAMNINIYGCVMDMFNF
jgi:hypothetical protein